MNQPIRRRTSTAKAQSDFTQATLRFLEAGLRIQKAVAAQQAALLLINQASSRISSCGRTD